MNAVSILTLDILSLGDRSYLVHDGEVAFVSTRSVTSTGFSHSWLSFFATVTTIPPAAARMGSRHGVCVVSLAGLLRRTACTSSAGTARVCPAGARG